MVCERVGLCKIASKVADEVYEKLALEPQCRISFNNFIALIQDGPVVGGGGGVSNAATIITEEERKQHCQQLTEITLSSSPPNGDDDCTQILHNLITSNQSYNMMNIALLSSSASSHVHAISGLFCFFFCFYKILVY